MPATAGTMPTRAGRETGHMTQKTTQAKQAKPTANADGVPLGMRTITSTGVTTDYRLYAAAGAVPPQGKAHKTHHRYVRTDGESGMVYTPKGRASTTAAQAQNAKMRAALRDKGMSDSDIDAMLAA